MKKCFVWESRGKDVPCRFNCEKFCKLGLGRNRSGPGYAQTILNASEFYLPLGDLGAGAVDTSLSRGVGSATFTRATTATTVNSSGLIASVATGVARAYYDPATLEYMGYLAEGARTNLCLQSEDFGTTWVVSATTVTTNSVVAPDGATTADRIVEAATTAQHRIQQAITFTAAAHTISVFAKKGEQNYIWLFESSSAAGYFFNLNTGALVGSTGFAAPTSSAIVAYPNGWYRCSITVTTTAAANSVFIGISPDGSTLSYAGSTSNGVYLWGAQVELGSFASSYIPTTTAAVTRNADVLTYPSSGNYGASSGTLYCEANIFGDQGAITVDFLAIDSGATSTSIDLGMFGANAPLFQVTDTTTQASLDLGTLTLNSQSKLAGSYASNSFYGCINGGSVVSDLSGTVPAGLTTIRVGTRVGGSVQAFGTIKNARIWQTQLTDAQLGLITG